MLIGKLLCGIGRVHLEPAAGLRVCSTPKSLIKNHKTPACAQWSSYLGCADKSNVLGLIADEQELTTANFIIIELKGYVWSSVLKSKAKTNFPIPEWRCVCEAGVGGELT